MLLSECTQGGESARPAAAQACTAPMLRSKQPVLEGEGTWVRTSHLSLLGGGRSHGGPQLPLRPGGEDAAPHQGFQSALPYPPGGPPAAPAALCKGPPRHASPLPGPAQPGHVLCAPAHPHPGSRD